MYQILSSDDSNDELIDSNNHIISAIEDHETRITRLQAHQDQLQHHINELTGTLVMGIRQSDIFYNAFAISTYALRLSTHIKEVKLGLYTLLNGNKLHPNLASYTKLVEGVTMLKKIALKSSKKLILDL